MVNFRNIWGKRPSIFNGLGFLFIISSSMVLIASEPKQQKNLQNIRAEKLKLFCLAQGPDASFSMSVTEEGGSRCYSEITQSIFDGITRRRFTSVKTILAQDDSRVFYSNTFLLRTSLSSLGEIVKGYFTGEIQNEEIHNLEMRCVVLQISLQELKGEVLFFNATIGDNDLEYAIKFSDNYNEVPLLFINSKLKERFKSNLANSQDIALTTVFGEESYITGPGGDKSKFFIVHDLPLSY